MRTATLIVIVIAWASAARADDRVTATLEAAPPVAVGAGFASLLEGVGATEASRTSALELGPRARAFATMTQWNNELDAGASGWRIAARVERALGAGIVLELNGAYDRVDGSFGGRFGRGALASFGARLVRYFHWSGGRVAWIALGIETSTWLGDAHLAAPAGTVIGLHVGTTF